MTCFWLPWMTQHLHLYQSKTQNGFWVLVYIYIYFFFIFILNFNLFIKEGYLFVCLFVCYVMFVRMKSLIAHSTLLHCALGTMRKSWMSKPCANVIFIMFKPVVQELSNIEQFCH